MRYEASYPTTIVIFTFLAVVTMGFMDKIKGKLSSSSSSSGSGENKRASFAGSSPQAAAAAAPSSTQTPAAATAANPATSATAAAPAAATPATATTTTAAAATTAPATTAAATTTPATTASNPATTAGNDTSYQPEPATEANKSTGATPTTSSTNMTSYTGTCHCKHHEWTVELTPDQSKHILWYVHKQSHISFFVLSPKRKPTKLTNNLNSHCDTCKILGGGAYTLNQIIPKSALKITKGGEPGKYTYYGDSGKVPPPSTPFNHPPLF